MPFYGKGFETMVASLSEYEEVVVEMYHDGKFVGQLNQERGKGLIDIEFGHSAEYAEVCRRVDLAGFLTCVETARRRLLGEIP